MTAENLKLIYQRDRLARRILVGVAGLLVGYLYLGSNIAFGLVGRQVAQEELTRRQTQITILETEYLALASAVTLDLAYARGFREAGSDTIFVRRSGVNGPVALGNISR